MDARTAAHALATIAAYLELRGENRFKTRAYEQAARAVQQLNVDDLRPLLDSGALKATPNVGPATLSVIEDLVRTGESSYLERLRAEIPEGLLAMLRVPGLSISQIHRVHQELDIASVDELEAAARDGRIAKLPRFSAKTAARILAGIEKSRMAGARLRIPQALVDADRFADFVVQHPDVVRASVAGSVRRHVEVVSDIDIVAGCRAGIAPADVARDFATATGVRDVEGLGTPSVAITYVDGARFHLHCVADRDFAVALWRATGSEAHVGAVTRHLADRGIAIEGDTLRRPGRTARIADEPTFFRLAGLAYIEPEMRETGDEVAAAAADRLPALVTDADLRGVLHCHSDYSDGVASIREMAAAAQQRGWQYLGISDHSMAAFYAGGLSPDRVLEQHAEIDALNAELAPAGFRVLKGIEADILADGRIDYDEAILARFDYVIGSVHSRFRMNEREMTDRVLAALDSPYLTVLGHPTGRLLLSRDPYALDVDAVVERAAANRVALEINADPHRLDLDWRYVRRALECGATIEIGPDAHSPRGLDNTRFGVAMARKGWVTRNDVLNARPVDDVLAFAQARREGR